MTDILPQLLVNSLIAGSIYALVAGGLSISYGIMKILNFAHGHLMMVGAYLFFFLRYTLELSIFSSIMADIILMSIVGLFAFLIFIQPFLKFSTSLPFVTSLALANILEALVVIFFGVDIKSLPLTEFSTSIVFANIFITPIEILIIVSAFSVLLISAVLINFSSSGRSLKAISENAYSAQGLAINSRKITAQIFIISTILAAFAGVLVAYETTLQPTMGRLYTMKAMAAMVLGGLGNIWGTIVAAYLISLIENLSSGLEFGGVSLPAGYKDAFTFSIILIVLLVRPQGLFGSFSRKV